MSTIPSLTALAAASFAADDNLIVDDTSLATTKRVEAQNLLDALLRIAAAGGVLMLDATAEKIIIRERGGTAGTDEVQVYHDGGNAFFESKSGYPILVAEASDAHVAVLRKGSTPKVYVATSGVYLASGMPLYFVNSADAANAPSLGVNMRTTSEVEITDGSTGRRDLAARTLIARQDGGVVGTDEVQILHDGTDGFVESKSNGLYFKTNGISALLISGGADNVYLGTNTYLRHIQLNWSLYPSGEGLLRTLIEANTAGSGSPNILTATESRTALTNEGATAENYHTLPTAAAGLDFEFVCQDGDGIRITANTGDTIRDVATVSATAGYIRSSTIGSVIRLKAINATEWFVVYKQGTWTVDS